MNFLLPLLLSCALLQGQDPAARLRPLLGIPYVADGTEDAAGRFVLFTSPNRPLPHPGLNCSGFLVAAARRLLNFRGDLAAATRDRRGDSGPGAPGGQDWDFGLDLILNLSEGRPRRQVLLRGTRPLAFAHQTETRGFSFGAPTVWDALTPRLRSQSVYLASLSWVKEGRLAHHHVALLLKDAQGCSWFYQTLPKGRVHRISVDTPEGRARLQQMFGTTQRMFLLEVDQPSAMEGAPIQR